MVFIYVTCKNAAEARKLGKGLVEKHLAACVNIWPIESHYFWKEKIVRNKEAVLLIKSEKGNARRIKDFVLRHHSYEVPFIGALNVRLLSKAYGKWMREVMRKGAAQ